MTQASCVLSLGQGSLPKRLAGGLGRPGHKDLHCAMFRSYRTVLREQAGGDAPASMKGRVHVI